MKQHSTTLENIPTQAAREVIDTATLALLASSQAEDFTTDAGELRKADEEIDEFKKTMKANGSW